MISFKNKKDGRFGSGERNCRKRRALFIGGAALVKTLRCGCMKYRALADNDYGAKVRLRSLIGEYGDFQIVRTQTVDRDIRTLFAQPMSTLEMKDARKREVDFSVQPKDKSLRLIKFNK